MCSLLLFGGTNEGRILAEYCDKKKKEIWVSVATEYGCSLLPQSEFIHHHQGRMDAEGMVEFCKEHEIRHVIDATHPHAVIVSAEIKKAVEELKIPMYRVVREGVAAFPEEESITWVNSMEEAISYLSSKNGKIFVSTGSKEAAKLRSLPAFPRNVILRILDSKEVLEECKELGFLEEQILSKKGPFTIEENILDFLKFDAKYLITKESGAAGGFREKIIAANSCDMEAIVIRRPKEVGMTLKEVKRIIDGED